MIDEKLSLPTKILLRKAVREFYAPLRNLIMENSLPRETLEHLFHMGKLRYVDGVFVGEIPAEVSLYLKEHGAQWDVRKRGWAVPLHLLPVRVADLAQRYAKKDDDLKKALMAALMLAPTLVDAFLSGSALTDLGEAAAGEALEAKALTPSRVDVMRMPAYDERVRAAMKRWAATEATRTAEKIEQIAAKGGDVQAYLRKRQQVGEYRAEMVARSETAIEVNNHVGAAEIQAGRVYYRWITMDDDLVRPAGGANPFYGNHRVLHDTIQRWDSRPVVDGRGRRAHPQEDFNCRCIAVSLNN